MLKHAPIILVGGLEAWKKEFGEAEVTKGDGEVAKPPPPSTSTETFALANPPTPQLSAKNPFANGTIPSALSSSSGGANSTEQHQVWTPARSRADTNPSNNYIREHRPTYSLDQAYNHVRYVFLYSASEPDHDMSIPGRPLKLPILAVPNRQRGLHNWSEDRRYPDKRLLRLLPLPGYQTLYVVTFL